MTRRARPSPQAAQETLHRAVAAHRAGLLDDARSLYRAVLASFPKHAGTQHLLAALAQQQGRHEEALTLLIQAAKVEPRNAAIRGSLAASQRALGRLSEAEASYRRAIALKPDLAEAHNNLGNLLAEQAHFPSAADSLRRAVSAKPDFPDAHNNLGTVLEALGRGQEAGGAYLRALALRPGYPQAKDNLARLSHHAPLEGAEACYERFLAEDWDEAALARDYGAALYRAGRLDAAIAAYDAALARCPKDPALHNNRGVARQQLGRLERAIEDYRRAIDLKPDYADAHGNLGIALKECGRFEEAIACHDRALAIAPEFGAARHNRALAELTLGRFERAWADYRSRDGVDRARAPVPTAPLAADLRGLRLCILRDQGLGDELFFLRFVPELVARGAIVDYEPHPKLRALLNGHPSLARLRTGEESDDGYDAILSVADLPYLVGMHAAADAPRPFVIEPAAERLARIGERLASFGPAPYVGITWRAGTARQEKLFKSVDPAAIGRLLAPLGCTAVVLQRAPQDDETRSFEAALGRPFFDASSMNDDLVEMAAMLALLDDGVVVSNTNLHLSAGLGKTCRVLVPNPAEFRWPGAGGSSPWFPNFSVYRQSLNGDWADAFTHLAQDLLKEPSNGGDARHPVAQVTRP